MSNNSNSSSGGISLLGVVFVAFMVLKLLGKIDWSWWWITAPLWGPVLLVVLGLGIYAIVTAIKTRRMETRAIDKLLNRNTPNISEPKKSKFQIKLEEAMKRKGTPKK